MLGGLFYVTGAILGAAIGMRLGWLLVYETLSHIMRKKEADAQRRLSAAA